MPEQNQGMKTVLFAIGAAVVVAGVLALIAMAPSGVKRAIPSPEPGSEVRGVPAGSRGNEPVRPATELPGLPVPAEGVMPPSGGNPPAVGSSPPGGAPMTNAQREEQRAAEYREGLGGTIESAADRLRAARDVNTMWDTERSIYWGWGTKGVLKALALWQEKPRRGNTPNDGALWLARSQAEFLLGQRESAAESLVKAVLGMERDKVQGMDGEPRLLGYAGRPNASPYGVGETEIPMYSWGDRDDGASGSARWGGGTVLVWEGDGEEYFNFVLSLAADEDHPEQAMAATVWAHAVVLRYHRQFPNRLPPAALRFLKARTTSTPPVEDEGYWWSRAFEDAYGLAFERQDSVASRLKEWRDRMWALRDHGWKSRPVSDGIATVLWSAEDEFRARFSAVDTPRAGDLRALAMALLK